MNKKSCVYLLGISVLALVIFNLFVLVINTSFEENFWSGYLFTMLSYVLVNAISFGVLYIGKNINRNLFYAMHIIIFSLIYVVLQTFAGICIIFVEDFNLTTSIIVQMLLLILYFMIACILLFYKSNTESAFEATKVSREFKNDMLKHIEIMKAGIVDVQSKVLVDKLYDQVYYEAENISTSEADNIERAIINKLGKLEAFIEAANIEAISNTCKEISVLLKQRNVLCKNRL